MRYRFGEISVVWEYKKIQIFLITLFSWLHYFLDSEGTDNSEATKEGDDAFDSDSESSDSEDEDETISEEEKEKVKKKQKKILTEEEKKRRQRMKKEKVMIHFSNSLYIV